MRRNCILGAIAISVVVLILTASGYSSGGSITEEKCDQIKVGMTKAEVETILGGPAGDYGLGTATIEFSPGRPTTLMAVLFWDKTAEHRWLGDNLVIGILFDDEDRVTCLMKERVVRERTFFQQAVQWLRNPMK